MKILVVAATWQEIALLAVHFHLPEKDFVRTSDFDLLITGVGMTATAYALGKHLSGAYKLVLNLGIAGTFDPAISLGAVVNVTSDEFTELGAEDGDEFLSIEKLGFGKANFIAANNLLHASVTKLKKVKGITVNLVHGNESSIKKVLQQANPQTESMEGAAVLYCCHQASLPCLQIRSISNYIVRRNKESWQIGLAIKELNKWAIDFLTNT
ncbi:MULTISPECIES: futalosine hydrolase [Pedobacter]|uniref:Futalosine hydrolase n=1 Tax=Pedobacter heparinus (strain ATCC 13125 / DSM 2366 / CIP 104194 / JCM 7457 / NBRC 12017 / NCIMB 9290 / NRRL B-14731 / HIM 762-3) TaxID=485917 RepID=C6XWQ3_PEDHD|nr:MULTISPECIES: futalosine hydrolase [Pedobacter]ACU06342.1 purine or other phosphorylase family 1 [Pedobacter heparinus DSM 2366]MBB5437318.1 futalosine hydrolase [Pedobacter sp. AK017]